MASVKKSLLILRAAQEEIEQVIDLAYAQKRYKELSTVSAFAHLVKEAIKKGELIEDSVLEAIEGISSPLPELKFPSVEGRVASGRKIYPRFEREGDAKLIKIGWSKKERREYEHRTPRDIVLRVAELISESVKPGRIFTIERLMPMKDAQGAEIPSYQTYLALAWFRVLGIVKAKGKEGYQYEDGRLQAESLLKAWEAIDSR